MTDKELQDKAASIIAFFVVAGIAACCAGIIYALIWVYNNITININ